MSESFRPSSRGALPWGLIGTILPVLMVELFVARHEFDFKPGWYSTWQEAGRAARRKVSGAEILCLGDSQVKHGLLPKVLESRLHWKTVNLAFAGGQASTSYFQLRRALGVGAKPAAVVIDFNPILLHHGLEANTDRWPEFLDLGECFDLARTERDAGFFAQVTLSRIFPALKLRAGVRAAVKAALRGESFGQQTEALRYARNARINQGAVVFPKNPGYRTDPDLDAWFSSAFPNPRLAHVGNMRYVERLFRFAESQKIVIFWVMPPNHPAIEERLERGGIAARYSQLLQSAQARFPHLVIIDARPAHYPASAFFDQGHLDSQGARTFSAEIADIVRTHLAGDPNGPRLVALPPYRDPQFEVPLEDLNQSLAIVTAGDDRRRR